MSPLLVLVVVLIAAVGLAAARQMRRVPRDREVLAALGFTPGAIAHEQRATWRGRALVVVTTPPELTLRVPLAASPLAYQTLVRALGRGDLLAQLFQLAGEAGSDALALRLPAGLPAKSLRRELDRAAALADALERLPRAEGMARWYLELTQGEDRAAALTRLITAFPTAPEILAACRAERTEVRDARAAALARSHLEAVAPGT